MQNADIPHGDILGYFENGETFWNWMETQEKFPMVVKFCHLTQGSQQCPEQECPKETRGNTFFLSKKEKSQSEAFKKWVDFRWTLLSEDPGRPWEKYMQEPLHSVPPGIFIQGAFPLFKDIDKPLEIKISVLWGKSYFGRFETGPGDSLYYERAKVYFQRSYDIINEFPWPYAYKRDHGFDFKPHLKCAEELAEKNAQALKMDYLRVDIFLNPEDPTKCAINEHSIFEPYVGHLDYHMMHAWAQPYLQGKVRLSSEETPSYEMAAAEGLVNPRQRDFKWEIM